MIINWWMDKRNVTYSYYGILLSNKKWIIDTHNNIDECQEKYTKWKKLDKNRVHTVWFHFCKIPEIANTSVVTESRSALCGIRGKETEEWDYKGPKGLWGSWVLSLSCLWWWLHGWIYILKCITIFHLFTIYCLSHVLNLPQKILLLQPS